MVAKCLFAGLFTTAKAVNVLRIGRMVLTRRHDLLYLESDVIDAVRKCFPIFKSAGCLVIAIDLINLHALISFGFRVGFSLYSRCQVGYFTIRRRQMCAMRSDNKLRGADSVASMSPRARIAGDSRGPPARSTGEWKCENGVRHTNRQTARSTRGAEAWS